jgi:hypothetical protein
VIDEKVLNECLNVQFRIVRDIRNIKKIINLDDLAAGQNKRRIIQQVGDDQF